MSSWIKEKDEKKLINIEEKLFGFLTKKMIAILLTVGYVVSLIPLIWIGFYNYPSADDYSIGSNTRQIWVTTHNVFAVLWAGIVRAVDDWLHWMGYFTSNFLMATPPSSFGEKAACLNAIIMIGMLSASTAYLLYAIFVKAFHLDKYLSWSVIMLMLFATVQCMCTAGRNEAFYWYSGAVNYTFVHAMANFFLGMMVSAYGRNADASEEKYVKRQKRILIGAAPLGFFVGGGNQMTALNVAVVLLLAIILISYLKKWFTLKGLWIPFGAFYIGFILNIVSPGNWVRSSISNGVPPVKAVLISFLYCLNRPMDAWMNWAILLLFALIAVLSYEMTGETTFTFPCPLVVIVLAYCLAAAMFTPPIFAVGNIEAGRLQGLCYIMFILLATLSIWYTAGWARHKFGEIEKKSLQEQVCKDETQATKDQLQTGEDRLHVTKNQKQANEGQTQASESQEQTAKGQDRISENQERANEGSQEYAEIGQEQANNTMPSLWLRASLGIGILFLLFGIAITVVPDPHYFTFSSAMTDLRNGTAKAFYEENLERTRILTSGQPGVLEIKRIKNQPALLFFSDITPDKEEWENRGMSRYFGIEAVVLVEK